MNQFETDLEHDGVGMWYDIERIPALFLLHISI